MVLILVVMEDALALFDKEFVSNLFGGLNPCCNGRCTRTSRPLGGMAVGTAS